MVVVREGWVEVVLVEVDGGEEENAGAGGDEGVAEDDVPVGEVVEETPVVPLLHFYQKILKLHIKFPCLCLIISLVKSLTVTKYPIINRR